MNSTAVTIIVIFVLVIIVLSIWYARKGVEEKPKPVIYPSTREEHSELELEILFEINSARNKASKEPLKFNDVVSLSCQSHIDMCARVGKVSHADWILRSDDIKKMLPVSKLGEVVAYGHRNAKSVVESFLRSSDHKAILLGNYNELGISARRDSDGRIYVGIITIKLK